MERMILTSQASGQLNLRGRGMREVPPDVFADLSGADGAPREQDKAGGVLRTTTRTHSRARRTFTVDAHADARTRARTRFVVEYIRPSYERVPSARFQVVVHSTSVEFVVLSDPGTRPR